VITAINDLTQTAVNLDLLGHRVNPNPIADILASIALAQQNQELHCAAGVRPPRQCTFR